MVVATRAQATRAAILRNQQLAAERDEQRRSDRFVAITKTMPFFVLPQLRQHWRAYVAVAVSQLGKRQLERVVWPWEPRPQRTPMRRGKVRP